METIQKAAMQPLITLRHFTWGKVLHDHDVAEAVIDRVLEKGRLID